MRLLNVHTMKLEEYFGSQIPRYTILSHCWGAEEVTFQHMSNSKWRDMRGATKIKHVSSYCKEEGFRYVWIDTCCIDKSSSAELSEAINSMFGWYEGSVVCYAYLEDVRHASSPHAPNEPANKDRAIRGSRWFSRGWTLQELIAPKTVYFFDSQWRPLGSKKDLCSLLSSITTIPEEVLVKPGYLRDCSVARKMTWAANRQTTRIEDVAYSLFGIFDVNMPLLYGEGQKAFIRLQEEILKETDDQSLLAWGLVGNMYLESTGVFANSPEAFLGSEDVVPFPSKAGRQPQSMTNRGVRIELPLWTNVKPYSERYPRTGDSPYAMLDCQYKNDFSGAIGIPLIPTGEDSIFLRNPKAKGVKVPDLEIKVCKARTIYISKRPFESTKYSAGGTYLIRARSAENKRYDIFPVLLSPGLWDEKTKVLKMEYTYFQRDPVVIAFCNPRMGSCFIVKIGCTLRTVWDHFRTDVDTGIKIHAGPVGANRLDLEKWVRDQRSDLEDGGKNDDTVVLPHAFNHSGRITVSARITSEEILNQKVRVLSVSIS